MVKPSGVSMRRGCSAVWGGVGFRGDGVRLSSDEGVAGVRLRRRKGIFEHLYVVCSCAENVESKNMTIKLGCYEVQTELFYHTNIWPVNWKKIEAA